MPTQKWIERVWLRCAVSLLLTIPTSLLLAVPNSPAQSGTCAIAYKIVDQWDTGFKAEVTINNSGPAINGWTLAWSFANGQSIYQLWGGVVTQNGSSVTVTNVDWNRTIPTGGSASFGFLATRTSTNSIPTGITLNGSTCGGANANPTVSITSPANNATFNAPANITINATASDSDGTIARVEFLSGTTLLGADTTSPYSFSFNNVAAGSYSLTARAFDNLGASATSAAVNVTVGQINPPPTVVITNPANGASFTSPANITISATASDSNGTIARVEFFNGTTLLSSDTTAPYSSVLNNVAAGNYTFTARAFDNQGASTTSAAVNVTVGTINPPPTVSITSPATGATFTAPANVTVNANASDSNGTIARVEFLRGGVVVGTDTTSPYSFTHANLAAGSYALAARAFDNGGASTTSSTVNITVQPPPSVLASVTTLGVSEASSAQYGVRLSSPPTVNTLVTISKNTGGDVDLRIASATSLTFTTANWNTFQMVTISAAADADSTNGSAIFTAGASGYLPVSVTANEVDRDGAAFVTRCGIHFCLNGRRFYFAGANTYDVFTFGDGSSTATDQDIETRFMDKARIDAHFTKLQQDGVTVLRLWMFSHEAWHGFEPQRGVYSEAQFRLFDYIIQSAKAHNVKLVPVFENYWEAYGGIDTRLQWEGVGGGHPGRWRFFNRSTCAGCFTTYKNYLSQAINRVNHYSGIAYKNEPTIFAWDLMNEPRYQDATPNENSTGTTLRAWVDEMATFVKSLDPNHMVMVGLEAHESRFGFGGNEGNPFVFIQQSPNIDMTSAHPYPTEPWANLSMAQTRSLIRTWIQESHNVVGKPFFMSEFNNDLGDRSAWWREIFAEMEASDGDGSAFWWYADRQVDPRHGVLQGAPELSVFRTHSMNMQSKNVSVTAATAQPAETFMMLPPVGPYASEDKPVDTVVRRLGVNVTPQRPGSDSAPEKLEPLNKRQ